MIWQIILLIIIFLLIIPIPIKLNCSFNVLRLSGQVDIRVLKFINYNIRVRFRGAYVYVTRKNKTRREKLTSTNYNVAYVMQLIRQLYFRLVLTSLTFVSEEGYYNDAMITAIGSGIIDIISKCAKGRILHNKKSAHIFIQNQPRYNQDCLNLKLKCEIKISLFDIFYSIINSLWSIKGEKYEKSNSTTIKQDKEFN